MKILLTGAGGYGENYARELLNCKDPDVRWEGVVDPFFESCSLKEEIRAAGVPVFGSMEEFYAAHTADLTVIATPTHLHCRQSIFALEHGSCVLCEKPLAPTVEEAQQMLEAEKRTGRFIAIGYQWSFSSAMQALKRDVLDGVLGAPVSLKTIVGWPRNRAYFRRGSGWAGRISKDGVMILDSIAANACAHYLHNMLFLMGDRMETAAMPAILRGDCLRANPIENFDTCTLQMVMESGVRLYFAASHAVNCARNPEFVYTFENAVVTFAQDEDSLIHAEFDDGRTKCYGNPFAEGMGKLWRCVDAVRSGMRPVCTVETAMPHNRVIWDLYKNVEIRSFPEESIGLDPESDCIFVDGLFEKLCLAYERSALLSEV